MTITPPPQLRSAGVYRVPYVDGTKVRVSNDAGAHVPPNRYDLVGTDGDGDYHVAAAAAGTVFRVVDRFSANRPDGNPCDNNYVWIAHANGEWTKYTHLRQDSVTNAGVIEGLPVVAGQDLGIQGDVGCAHGEHLHFEVAVPIDPANPIDPDGGIIGGYERNRIPWICGIPDRRLITGRTVTAGSCSADDVATVPEKVGFSPVPIGQSATMICTVVNLGHQDATIRIPASPGGSALAWFPVTATLGSGEFVDVSIVFTPTRVLPAQANMIVTIDGRRSLTVGILGRGVGAEPTPRPRVIAAPTSVRFGSVDIGDRATRSCTVSNVGVGATRIQVADSPPGSVFSWARLTTGLAAGESVTVPIRFRPTRIGAAQATVIVDVNGQASIRVGLTGDGTLEAPLIRTEPAGSLSMGQVRRGRSKTHQVRIVNASEDEQVTIRIREAAGGAIRWPALSAVLAPGAATSIPVTFRPIALGRVPATLSIGVTDPIAHVVRLSISGTGTGGPHED